MPSHDYARLSSAQMAALRAAHKDWAEEVAYNGGFKAAYPTWLVLKGHFGGVSRLRDLPADWFLNLIEFCRERQQREIGLREARKPEPRSVVDLSQPVLALPGGSHFPESVYLDFAEDVRRAHRECRGVLQRMQDKAQYLAEPLFETLAQCFFPGTRPARG